MDGVGFTPLHVVAAIGHTDIIELLLSKGADIKAVITDGIYVGSTPLHLAAQRGRTGVVELLLAQGADTDLTDGRGKTALDYAISDEMKALLRKK